MSLVSIQKKICQLDVRYVFINPGNIFNFLLHRDQPNSLEQAQET